MSAATPDPTSLNQALRRMHRSSLATLALCALWIAISGDVGSGDPEPRREYTLLALGLGLGSIVLRRFASSPSVALRSRVHLTLASLALAALIGVVGVATSLVEADSQTGLLLTLGAAILCLRPPEAIRIADPGS